MSGRRGYNQVDNGRNNNNREHSGSGGGRDDRGIRPQSDNKSNYSDNSGAKPRTGHNNNNKFNNPNDGGARYHKGNYHDKKFNNYSNDGGYNSHYDYNNSNYYYEDPIVKLSKSLSRVLRHNALREGLKIEPDGYVKVEDLLNLPKFRGTTFEKINLVVKQNDKQRFALIERKSASGESVWWIRANQGHSLEVKELDLEKITDPSAVPQVIHGTYSDKWGSIRSQGLSRMNRNHIHFAIGKWGDANVTSGMRSNCDLFIYANVSKAIEDGISFYKSANGVILTEGIDGKLDKKYFLKVVDASGKIIYSDETSGENKNKNKNKNKNTGGNNVNKNAGENNVNNKNADKNNVNNIKDVDGNNVSNKNADGNIKDADGNNVDNKNADGNNVSNKNADGNNVSNKNADGNNVSNKNADGNNVSNKNADGNNVSNKNADGNNVSNKNAGRNNANNNDVKNNVDKMDIDDDKNINENNNKRNMTTNASNNGNTARNVNNPNTNASNNGNTVWNGSNPKITNANGNGGNSNPWAVKKDWSKLAVGNNNNNVGNNKNVGNNNVGSNNIGNSKIGSNNNVNNNVKNGNDNNNKRKNDNKEVNSGKKAFSYADAAKTIK